MSWLNIIRKWVRAGAAAVLVGTEGAAILATTASQPVSAGGLDELWGPRTGCYDVRSYGVGLLGTGTGTVLIPAQDGRIAAAFLQWVGAKDITPEQGLGEGQDDSTLLVNGSAVVGRQPAAGWGPQAQTFGFPDGWFTWFADIGPSGTGILTTSAAQSLNISGWDRPEDVPDGRNGAAITIVTEQPSCTDVYWHGLPEHGHAADSFHTQFCARYEHLSGPRRSLSSSRELPRLPLKALSPWTLVPASPQPDRYR